MADVVADTHAVLWYLHDSTRLSTLADKAISGAIWSSSRVLVASISIVEITYLYEKRRISDEQFTLTKAELNNPESPFELIPLTFAVADALARVSVREVPDMPDRIIAATALHLGLPLVTRDRKIRSANIETIW